MSGRSSIHIMRSTPSQNVRTDIDVIEEWNPKLRPVACANCLHCKVSSDESGLYAHCDKGYGNGLGKPLLGVIKQTKSRGFRDASKCPDFSSMDDDRSK